MLLAGIGLCIAGLFAFEVGGARRAEATERNEPKATEPDELLAMATVFSQKRRN